MECSLEGGQRDRDPATRASKPEDMFLLVNEDGNPMESTKSEKILPFRMYYAKKPALAAVKAYYALIRSTKPEKSNMSLLGIQDIEEHCRNSNAEHLELYMNKVREAQAEPSAYIRLRRPDENKIRTYYVGYERVLKPNKHEIEKGIVKVAIAKKI